MLRSVAMTFAVSSLAAACAVGELAPQGTSAIQAVVRNKALNPIAISVSVPGQRVLPGAVQPPLVPAGPSETNLTILVPRDARWQIDIAGYGEILADEYGRFIGEQCGSLVIQLELGGGWGWGCGDRLEGWPPP